MAEATKSKELYDFRRQVKALSQFRGRGTELVSLYISPGYPVAEVTGKLREEFGQAANIKSASTRKNVQGALEKLLHYLKGVSKPPENGIAVFAGNVSETEGKVDIQLYSVVPPLPLRTQFYRCESTFVLEPLEEMLAPTGAYGLVVVDGSDAAVGLLRGKTLKVVKELHNLAPSKVHKGGQSAARYARIREEAYEDYFKRIGEAMDSYLQAKDFRGFIVGGPGPVKENFLKQKTYNYQLKQVGLVDTSYSGEFGLREVLEKAEELIQEQEAVKERKLIEEFMAEAARGGPVAYGVETVREALSRGKASRLLLSEALDEKDFELACSKCGEHVHRIAREFAEEQHSCGGKLRVEHERDVTAELIDLAEAKGTPVEMVSTETPHGQQFAATFKAGAFLRYR
jgi:peptide chain release factor subunit 1